MIRFMVGVFVGLLLGIGAIQTASAHATGLSSESVPPYGGCVEGWQAPRSEGADWCRDHGWTIRKRLIVGPHGVVRMHRLPHCAFDEAQEQPCTWNIGRRIDGNGIGLSFWSAHGNLHYVWPNNPVRSNVGPRIHWVRQPLADALAEGDQPGRRWERCVTNGRHAAVITVACPDGYTQHN